MRFHWALQFQLMVHSHLRVVYILLFQKNPGTTVKKSTLNDNTITTKDFALSVDYYRKVTDNVYLNAGITKSSMKTKTTKATFEGGYVVSPFPTFTTKGKTSGTATLQTFYIGTDSGAATPRGTTSQNAVSATSYRICTA